MANEKSVRPYTCMETCGQEKPCGNRYCSAHPKHGQIRPNTKTKAEMKAEHSKK